MGGPELHGHHRWRYDRLRPDPAGRGGPAMTALTLPVAQPLPVPQAGPVLDVVVPVYNEEADLDRCVRRLSAHLRATFPYPFQITVADNASTDATLEVARALQRDLPEVSVVHLAEKGRGRALRAAWSASAAPVLAYLDVDLSTDLAALFPLVAPLISGHSDIAIGTRLSRDARVVRGVRREVISRCYNLLLRGTLAVGFSDAQCGFKAIRKDVAERLLPLVQDAGWFFDTELLVLAQQAGLRVHEVPVDWVEDPDSKVDIMATAVADLKGIARLARALLTGALPIGQLRQHLGRGPLASMVPGGLARQMVRFAGIGVLSTLAYLGLFVVLRPAAGAQLANLAALLLTAIANTAANRRLTFGVSGRHGAVRHHFQGLAVFALGLVLTSASLSVAHAVIASAGRLTEAGVLTAANLAAQQPAGTRWAVAGRSRGKLEALRDRLGVDVAIMEADVEDEASVRRLAEASRVVITTVGPYIRYGEPLVAACAQAGTDYVDLTGEPEFVDLMYLRYHAQAQRSGARLVHACGFDSIPSDLGALFTVEQLPGDAPIRMRGYVRVSGRPSGGTFDSMLTIFSRSREAAAAHRRRRRAEPRDPTRKVRAVSGRPGYDRAIGTWVLPLPTIDPQIVVRSAGSLDRYGPDFSYSHFAVVGNPFVAAGVTAGVAATFALAQLSPTRRLLGKLRPPGAGPTPEQRQKGCFRARFVADRGARP